MDNKVTSKTSSLKALLLKAWSERWTDLQWGIHIKAHMIMAVTSEEFVFNPWIILATKSHILPSQCASVHECNFGKLCDFCLYTKELTLPHFPEMVFPNNKLQIRHSSGFTIEFNALDALRGVIVGEMPLKVACSEDWKMSRKQTGYTETHVHPFDWTYTTEYSGTLTGDCRIEETSQRIDVEKLKVREEILFFKEVILFEDELHDNGIAISSVKFRAMPSGFFVLYRFFLRVDGVLVRVIDTRMHYELGNSFILRERSFREAKFSEIRHNSVAVSNDPTEYLHLVPVKYSYSTRGVSGDVYNLADIIFQQALVGPGPNQLILSYLKHSLSSQLVSYAAVVIRISKFDGFHKPYCVMCLLIFLENIENGITCRTKQEEGMLPGSILSLVNWLLDCYLYYLSHPCQFPDLLKKPILLLNKIMLNPFTSALLYLAKHENKGDYDKIIVKCKDIEMFYLEKFPNDLNVDLHQLLKNIGKLDLNVLKKPNRVQNFLDYSIQALLKVTVLLSPTIDSQAVVNNLLIIQQLKGYSNARLYMELIRGCFINLNDAVQEKCTAYWGALTFIKLPHIIQHLACHYASSNNYLPEQTSEEIVEGFMLLMEFCPLLNNIDTQTKNNNVESLLTEMVSKSIISNSDKNKILEVRKLNSVDVRKIMMLVPELSTVTLTSMISMTIPALTKILKSLNSDKLQEHFIGVLSHLTSGSSNELIPTFAAVQGELPHFVNQLIKFNELSRQINQNDGVSPHAKALIFDLTFVILCSIVQNYGSDVVLTNKGDSFFETWVRDCMKEYGCNKAMIALGKGYNIEKIKKLIEYFRSGEFDLQNPIMPWDEMCFAMPAVMKEIHDWVRPGNPNVNRSDVKRMFDAISSQMCCLSICSVSWLASHMQILPQDQQQVSRNMIQQFITLMDQKVRAAAENIPPQTARTISENKPSQQDLNKDTCRMIMSLYILRQMQNDSYCKMTPTDVVPPSRGIALKDAVYKQLVPVWEVVLQKGYLTSEAAHLFKTVISVSDPRLFMKFMLHEIMKLRFEDELYRAVDLLFAIFHYNIHDFTVALLNYLPNLLYKANGIELVEPQSTALAKLTAYVVCAAVQQEFNSRKHVKNNKDIGDIEQDLEELCPASKIMRMSGVQSGNTPLVYVSTGHASSFQQPTIADDSLLKSLSILFYAFDNVADRTGVVNSDTYFVFNVIKQIVDCGKEIAKPILANLPNTLIPNLMRSVPELFTMELILQLYCLDVATGARTTVRDLCLLRNLTMKP